MSNSRVDSRTLRLIPSPPASSPLASPITEIHITPDLTGGGNVRRETLSRCLETRQDSSTHHPHAREASRNGVSPSRFLISSFQSLFNGEARQTRSSTRDLLEKRNAVHRTFNPKLIPPSDVAGRRSNTMNNLTFVKHTFRVRKHCD